MRTESVFNGPRLFCLDVIYAPNASVLVHRQTSYAHAMIARSCVFAAASRKSLNYHYFLLNSAENTLRNSNISKMIFFFPFRFDLKLKIELRMNILNFKPNKTFTPQVYIRA